jgi:hypothetical protein
MLVVFNIVIGIIWGLYILGSLIKKDWNDFLYGICMALVMFLPIPAQQSIIVMILLIIVHRYIDRKERES